MTDIMHWISIDAPPQRVFDAVTTANGLSSWWTSDVEPADAEGDVAVFGFNDRSVVFRMRIDEMAEPQRVRWTCVGDFPEWEGTRIEFRIEEREDGRSGLTFTHAGWESTEGFFRQCNTDWGRLMYYLKCYLEGRGDGPMMD